MTPKETPFTDPVRVRGDLYAGADRLTRRTSALHRAKVAGRNAAEVIAELADEGRENPTVVDLGCGRGTTTLHLAQRLRPDRLLGIDLSAALLGVARLRMHVWPARFVRADFHHLPVRAGSCDVVVAAFCLYHSPEPRIVLREINRCLARGGTAVLATKAADSYQELDDLVAASGLDPAARERPSLYQAAHSGNLPDLVADELTVRTVVQEEHRFRFTDLAHLGSYLATNPKYVLPAALRGDAAAIATALRRSIPDQPITARSTVTYIIAAPIPGRGQA